MDRNILRNRDVPPFPPRFPKLMKTEVGKVEPRDYDERLPANSKFRRYTDLPAPVGTESSA
jgi:hypothetical protein